jgi:hypothetical protein
MRRKLPDRGMSLAVLGPMVVVSVSVRGRLHAGKTEDSVAAASVGTVRLSPQDGGSMRYRCAL